MSTGRGRLVFLHVPRGESGVVGSGAGTQSVADRSIHPRLLVGKSPDGGDFNCHLDPVPDRLSTKPPPAISSVGILNDFMKTRNMVDIWRLQHPTEEEFSFSSHVHKSSTRFDYFLIAAELLPSVTDSTSHNILISDHSPVSLNFRNMVSCLKSSWRFKPLLLEDQSFIEHMTARIDQ